MKKGGIRQVNEIQILEPLGEGNFGRVYRGLWQVLFSLCNGRMTVKETTEVALKSLHDQAGLAQFMNEASILQ